MSAAANNGFYVTIATARGATTKKVEGDLLSVGRAVDCNLSISHDTLNRRHMSVHLKNGECWIEDHGSTNGTYVNGKRILAHEPTRVRPDDTVALAQSGVRIFLSTEPIMPREVTPVDPLPKEKIVSSTSLQRKEESVAQLPALPRTQHETRAIAEEIVHEAMTKSSKILEEAQIDAERRVQDIYRRAHETQTKIEASYQERLNEAYRAAEGAFHKSQQEASNILQSARQKSEEIRHQSETFVLELRQRTEAECERLLAEAQRTARDLKENRLQEAEDMIRQKEELLIKHTRDAMADRMARLEEELDKETQRNRDMIEAEVKNRRAALEEELKQQTFILQNLKAEAKTVLDLKAREQATLQEVGQQIDSQRALAKELENELAEGQNLLSERTGQLEILKAEIEAHQKEQADYDVKIREARDRLKRVQEELRGGEGRVRTKEEDLQNQLLQIKEKFETERVRLVKEEQKRLEEMKLESARQIQTLEQSLLNEVFAKRERLSREIMLVIEKFLKARPETKNIGLRRLEDEISQLFQDQVVTMSKGTSAKAKQKSLVALRRREKMRTMLIGACAGAALLWSTQFVYRLKIDPAPMNSKLAAAAEQRKNELERRKFNPTQTREYRSTYMDNVIYNEGFVALYASDDFQKDFFKGLSAYLFKTWRLEEDKVIQVLATATATIKELQSKRDAIHPDFVNQSLEKMKTFETEMMTKIRQILGSQVRVESFKKYEKQFFEKYRAQHAP